MTLDPALQRLQDIASRCTYPGLALEVGFDGFRALLAPRFYNLRVTSPGGTCTRTGNPSPWKGRKWRLSVHMTDGEVVWTAFKAITTALEHEARELFKFDGATVADSHVDIHKLVALMKDPEALAEREHPAA